MKFAQSLNGGLSPRVRGKPNARPEGHIGAWSIPACAGEAGIRRLPQRRTEVYPRVCGGSYIGCPESIPVAGLSPRVRGKRIGSG